MLFFSKLFLALGTLSSIVWAQNLTLAQVGFRDSLNYQFVNATPAAAGQIFQNLGPAIAFGLSIDASTVTTEYLTYIDTRSSLGYITTLAVFTIPAPSEEVLALDILTPTSKLYDQPNSLQNQLVAQVNPAITTVVGPLPDDPSIVPVEILAV